MHNPLIKSHSSLVRNLIIILQVLAINNGVLAAGEDWSQKTEKKSAQRWTLKEWLAQKERNRWMDQWLILHTPTPYEFAAEISSLNYQITSTSPQPGHQSLVGSLTAYATLVGLEFQTNNNSSEGFIDNTGLFHLRLLGASDQASHFAVSLGQKRRDYKSLALPLRSQYLGQADLTLYFNNHFGLKALYREYSPLENDADFGTLKGSEQSLAIFIDFAALRIFGGPTLEKETQTKAGQLTERNTRGVQSGLRLYF
jgi:hypothetical protein